MAGSKLHHNAYDRLHTMCHGVFELQAMAEAVRALLFEHEDAESDSTLVSARYVLGTMAERAQQIAEAGKV